MKKKQDENFLERIPEIKKELKWEVSEATELVNIYQENKGFYNMIAQKFFSRPKVSTITLDDFGSFVWLKIDGKRNLIEIGKAIKEMYGEDAEPVYERLSQFIATLKNVGYIVLK